MLVPANLKFRWFLINAGVGVVLTIMITSILTQVATHRIEYQVGTGLAEVAHQMSDKLERGMFERYRDMQVAATLIEEMSSDESFHDEAAAMLATLQQTYPYYAWIGITDAKGVVQVSTGNLLEGQDVSARPWFQQARENYFIGDVHAALLLEQKLNPDSGEPLRFVDVALPLQSAQGDYIGVIGSHLNWAWANEVSASMTPSLENYEQAEVLIVSSEGLVLLGPPELRENPLPVTISEQLRTSNYVVQEWPDGTRYLTGYAEVTEYREYQGPHWQILVRVPVSNAFDPVEELRIQALWIGSGIALILAILGWFSADRMARPLANINEKLEREVRQRTAELRTSNAQLEQLATTDSLTRLANRRALLTAADAMMERATRRNMPLAVLMLDLDHFKRINDEYGHAAGDEVLESVGQLLSSTVRQIDIAARTGGEEFTILLEDSTVAGAVMVAERLLQRMEQLYFGRDRASFNVTLSIGVTLWEVGERIDKAFARADAALYEAKQKGRNRVITA
ncbi:diguanylate cyclase [Pseudidiomarina sp.]|uniref:sensor domain-containing diguanylate cyclase n=1 Tax=Pseudidiomarina sp. TaxID=2081707 RepID=UPI00299E7BB4|nr:diguanylate cyclase [Pseudidiomarina sp.]MDX1706011.1 diguanylate cyclase [Pseudidiomarina sp.]